MIIYNFIKQRYQQSQQYSIKSISYKKEEVYKVKTVFPNLRQVIKTNEIMGSIITPKSMVDT